MPANLSEITKYTQLYVPASRTTTGTLYEEQVTGTNATGNGLDTRDFDECVIDVSVGAVTAGTTLDISIVTSNDDNADNSFAVTGAAFTQIANANEDTARRGYYRCAGQARYAWAKVEKDGTADAALYSIGAILSKSSSNPTDTTYDFEV